MIAWYPPPDATDNDGCGYCQGMGTCSCSCATTVNNNYPIEVYSPWDMTEGQRRYAIRQQNKQSFRAFIAALYKGYSKRVLRGPCPRMLVAERKPRRRGPQRRAKQRRPWW